MTNNQLPFFKRRPPEDIAIILLWASYCIDRLKLFLAIPHARLILDQEEMKPHSHFEEIFAVSIVLCSFIFFAYLILKISQGRRWARNIYFFFALFDLYQFFLGVEIFSAINLFLSSLVIVTEMLAMIILFFMTNKFFDNSDFDAKEFRSHSVRNKPRIHRNSGAALFGIGFGLLCFAFVSNQHLENNRIHLLGFMCCVLVLIALLLTFKYNYDNSRRRGKR